MMGQKVLVLGDYRQTVTVVRSLARSGFRVTLGCHDTDSSTAHSRYVSDLWIYEGASAERFRDSVEAYLRRERPDFIFTVGESQLRRLIEVPERFEPLSTWVNPDPATVARCFDKSALYELAPRLGIPSMRWRHFTDVADWRASAHDMGFPVVVKRKDSAGRVHGRKALICHNAAHFDSFLATLSSEPAPRELVLQKYFAGVRYNCHVACADGRIVMYFQQKVLGTDELDETGAGTAGVSVAPIALLRTYCERLTRALDYTGIGCIQFLVDEATGEVGFLEFNARMDSTAALPYRLGFDFPRIAVELARYRRFGGQPPGEVTRPYALGRTYHFLQGDLVGWIAAARDGQASSGALARWAFRAMWFALRSYHLTFDLLDPLPTLHMHWKLFGRPLVHRMRRGARASFKGGRAGLRTS